MASNTNEYAEKKLQECLSSIYDSSRIATEINSLESKLDSLTSIKQTLISGENISPTNLDQMNKTIGDLQVNINRKRESMLVSEKQVIQAFLEVIAHISTTSTKQVMETNTQWTDGLRTLKESLGEQIAESLKSTEKSIRDLKENKLDISEKEVISNHMEAFKATLMSKFKTTLDDFDVARRELTAQVSNALKAALEKNNSAKIAAEVHIELEKKMQERLDVINQKNEEAIKETQVKFDSFSSAIANGVKTIIQTTVNPEHIRNLITSLPEYEALVNGAANIRQLASNEHSETESSNLEAMKQSVNKLASELVELKQSNQQTRTIVDTIRSQSVNQQDIQDLDHQVALKRMEEMEKEVSVIYNNIKMIETTIKLKSNQEDQIGNKRARIDLDGNSSVQEQYLSSLHDVQLKHQSLIDFIVQWKDTVLDESFHQRLEAVLAKIEQVLLNHERFIHFLVDPFTASKKETVSIPTTSVPEGTLSPAMIDAISKLVKKTAEEVSLPLENKIKLLEQKLQAKST